MGLKPRAGVPVELAMEAHGSGFSHRAYIDLRTGRCAATVSSRDWSVKDAERVTRSVELTIPRADLASLRAAANAILAAGDTEHRDQFAQQGVSFTARSRMRTATADFHIDVGVGTRYDHAWDIVFRRVHGTLETP